MQTTKKTVVGQQAAEARGYPVGRLASSTGMIQFHTGDSAQCVFIEWEKESQSLRIFSS